jgi:arsenate reductase (thioredoxin)
VIRVMFLCTGNSCRSQMAEGLARELGKGKIEAYSAGLAPSQVNPYAVRVMQEIGIDISRQTSKAINQDLILKMDVVITLCGHAEVLCPMTPPQVKRLHWPIDDPILATGTENEVLLEFRRARDQIRENLRSFMGK